MPKGNSGRIVLEIDPNLKKRLYSIVALEGRSLKDWFIEQAMAYITQMAVELQSNDNYNSVSARETESHRSKSHE